MRERSRWMNVALYVCLLLTLLSAAGLAVGHFFSLEIGVESRSNYVVGNDRAPAGVSKEREDEQHEQAQQRLGTPQALDA